MSLKNKFMKIFDISIDIKNGMVVYPDNPEVVIENYRKIPENSSTISKITFGSHTGTHLDAELHATANGRTIDAIPLQNFIGTCRVLDFTYLAPGELIKISDLEKHEILVGDRILAKTSNSSRGYDKFYADFVALDGEAAIYLANKKISLFGIDYLSIKQKGSKDNRSHTELLKNNIAILEGINLVDIDAGEYEIYCPPIKFAGIDGAPTRAILIKR